MRELLNELLNENLYQITLSKPKKKDELFKVKIKPVMLKGALVYQEAVMKGSQVFHTNSSKEEIVERIIGRMSGEFGQCDIQTREYQASILVSKKGKITINRKKLSEEGRLPELSHNRVKNHILKEGEAVPFLIELGVMTEDGRIIKSKYDKFRQINRYLEFLEDVIWALPEDREMHMVDFGCGKSYLTFAAYYYFAVIKGYRIRITGLDLKKDVIQNCSKLAEKLGYEKLRFMQGDIESFREEGQVDIVLSLHACDTATDHAIFKALEWKSRIILAVPCCHHEINTQISAEILEPVLKYGLIKERIAALVTDAVRANLLEEQGYAVQVLEFIDMEHTPKNILIRAVRKKEADSLTGIAQTEAFLNIHPALRRLLQETGKDNRPE